MRRISYLRENSLGTRGAYEWMKGAIWVASRPARDAPGGGASVWIVERAGTSGEEHALLARA